MKKRKKNIPVYSDDRVNLTILEDDNKECWLTPTQVEYLESRYNWARYDFALEPPRTSDVKTSEYDRNMIPPITVTV